MLILSFVQSFSFSVSYENVVIYLSFGLVVVGLFMPIYRAECIFGYVFGSIVFSGAIIPLIGILLIAGIPWSSARNDALKFARMCEALYTRMSSGI